MGWKCGWGEDGDGPEFGSSLIVFRDATRTLKFEVLESEFTTLGL